MILLVVKLVLMGEVLAISTIPTQYEDMVSCEIDAQQAFLARRDDVSHKTTLDVSCLDSKTLY